MLVAVEGRRAWQASLLVAAGPVLFLGLVAVRNGALTGRLDPTVMDPGAVFLRAGDVTSAISHAEAERARREISLLDRFKDDR